MNWHKLISEIKSHGLTETKIASLCRCTQPTVNDLFHGRVLNPLYPLGAALHELRDSLRRNGKAAAQKAEAKVEGE